MRRPLSALFTVAATSTRVSSSTFAFQSKVSMSHQGMARQLGGRLSSSSRRFNSSSASASPEIVEQWKAQRPLRIKAKYIHPGDDDTTANNNNNNIRDGIVVHFQRHGQGTHNQAYKDWTDEKGEHPDITSSDPLKNPLLCESMIDAPLTQKGINQCIDQQSTASKLQNVELIVMSPLLRAIQTAHVTFDEFRSSSSRGDDIKWMLHEDIREELGLLMCNKRRSLSAIQKDFPSIDCSFIKHEEDVVWDEYCSQNISPQDGSPMRENEFDMSNRAYKFLERFVANRNEKEIAVVGHSALFLSMTNTVLDVVEADEIDLITTMFGQAEIRSMELTFEEQ